MFATIYLICGFLLILPTLENLLMRSDGEVFLVGCTVTLNCSLDALNQTNYTPINITWYHNETTVVGDGIPILDVSSSVLVLHDVQFDDSGTYSCSLIEARSSARIYINVGLPPEPATALNCFSTNFDNAICTWNRGGQHSNLLTEDTVVRQRERESEWKVCTENFKGVSTMSSSCNQTTCSVECLHQEMGATYRVNSTNLLGANYTVLSKEVYFNIDTGTIPNPPSHVVVQNESASSLLITWTPDTGVDTEGKKDLVNYFVRYRWEGDEDWSEVKVKGKDIKRNAVLLIGLTNPYGLYYVKVKCSNRFPRRQYGQYSRVAAGRTSEIAPVDAPGNFSCFSEILERTGKRNIHLSWELLPNKFERNGEIIDQIIQVRHNTHMKDSSDVWIVGPNETSYTLKDMELEEQYEIRIRVRNSVRESGNYSLCNVTISTGDFSSVSLTIACVSSICLIAAFFWMGCKFYKKVTKDFPDFQLPAHLGNSNLYFSARSPHRTREKEVYDELISSKTLFVDLPPAEKTPFDSPGVSPGPNDNVAFSSTFDIGNAPQQAVASFPRAKEDDLNVPFSLSSPSDGDPHRHRHWSSETCTSSLNSPISVGSGGSYFFLRESDSTSYCVLAKDGFSPVREHKLQDLELPGVGSSAVGATPSCLDLENDSDGEVSIMGIESKKDSCKFGSPERVLYTRKHVQPPLTHPEVSQPRLLKAATGSPIKSREAAGLLDFLDDVAEEQEVGSLGTIQENDDDMSGKDEEEEVQDAGGDLGLSGTSEKGEDANEDDGIDIPSEIMQSYVDDVGKGGGASDEILGENASCRTDQLGVVLNYVTVCKDHEGDDDEDIEGDDAAGGVESGTGEDGSSLTMSSSGTSPIVCLSNHRYPGSSNGTYIDQAQLANISPISSPTRIVNPHDICDPGADP